MVEKDRVFSGKLKYSGIFDFKEFYKFCYALLVDMEYDPSNIIEKEYSEKITPTGEEIQIKWEARRRISDYFRFFLKIDWIILNLKKVEVEKEGVKITTNKGDVEIRMTAILEKDYENKWENNPFTKFLRGIYDKYIIKSRIEKYEEKVYEEAEYFLAQAKSFLDLGGRK